jgi:hypothetical protein
MMLPATFGASSVDMAMIHGNDDDIDSRLLLAIQNVWVIMG